MSRDYFSCPLATDLIVGKFFAPNLSDTMNAYVQHKTPAVTYTSTLSGAMGVQALRRFYEQYFIGRLPSSMRLRLLSRTVGADRVVDELYAAFEHTTEIPWMLPGVPPTNRRVEIVLVSIVSMRAGHLYSEHVYWDQASVLVQIGLLDPKLVPTATQGVDRLPVVGREAARRILHEDPEVEQEDYHNRLICRAHARARRDRRSRSSQLMEPTVDRSDAEQPLPDKKAKGKTMGESRPSGPQRTATEITEYEESHQQAREQSQEAKESETESFAQSKSAYVEDDDESSGTNGAAAQN